jgi:hypothetical protein
MKVVTSSLLRSFPLNLTLPDVSASMSQVASRSIDWPEAPLPQEPDTRQRETDAAQ